MATALVFAQELPGVSPDSTLAEAEQCYSRGEYNTAISMLESTLDNAPPGALSEFHKYLALCYAQFDNQPKAREYFKQALRYNAKLKLPPDTPERLVIIFNDAKRELSSEAAMCSCMLPGMGQMLKGETRKGQGIMLAFGVTGFSAGVTWINTLNKRTAYLDLGPDDIDRMDAAYSSYNSWHRTSVVLTALFACIYIYNIFDASSAKLNDLSAATRSNTFTCALDGDAARFCLAFRF